MRQRLVELALLENAGVGTDKPEKPKKSANDAA